MSATPHRLARPAVLITALALALSLLVVSPTATQTASAQSSTTLGMFVGFDRGDRFTQMERDLGRPLDWIVTMLDRRSTSAMRSSAWGQFASSNAYLPKLSNRLDVVVTVPLAFGAGGQSESAIRSNLQATASGRFDSDYRAIAQMVKDAGYGDAVIRLGHEMDDAWPPWSARNNAAQYIAAFRHVHDVLASVSPAFRFDWATTRAGFSQWGLPAYPGDAYVDVIGLDAYWRDATDIPDRDWTNRYESVFRQHLQFAKSRNKPVSFPEWGQANGNTGRYIELMHDWFRSLPTSGPGRLLYQAYFNDPSQSNYDLNNYPTTKRAYIDTFRNWNVSTTTATPTPTTAAPTTAAPTTAAPPPTTAAPTTTAAPPPTTAPPAPATTAPATTSTTAPPPPPPPAALEEPAAPAAPTGTESAGSVFSAGSDTEASLRLSWVDAGLRVEWEHPTAKLYIVRYRPTGTTSWKWLGTVGASTTTNTLELDRTRSYTVEVISYVSPTWRSWNSATIEAAPNAAPATTPTTAPAPATTQKTPAPAPAPAPATDTSTATVFSAGSDTEASLQLSWVDAGLRVDWEHPTAKLYIVRYRPTGTTSWKWLGTVGASTTTNTLELDRTRSYTVEVISYVSPTWRSWNSATIEAAPSPAAPEKTSEPATPAPSTSTSAGTSTATVFSAGSDTEASLQLSWVDAGLRVDWEHPTAKLYIVRYRPTGTTSWKWLGTVGASTTTSTLELDRTRDYTVEVISYVSPTWRSWNSATIEGTE